MSQVGGMQQDFQRLERDNRLGAPRGEAVPVEPPPLKNDAGSVAGLFVGSAIVGLGAWLFLQAKSPGDRTASMVLSGFGLLFLGAGGFALFRRIASRGSLSMHEGGLAFTRGSHKRSALFDEVDALTLFEKPQLSNGTRIGLLRRVELRGAGFRFRVRHLAVDGKPDAFGHLLSAMSVDLADRSEARIRSGSSLSGDGWTLDASGLRIASLGAPLPLSTLSAVGHFEGKLSIWRASDDLPVFSIPEGSRNAPLLGEIVRRHAAPAAAASTTELGRVLFRKGGSKAGLFLLGFLTLLALGSGIALVSTNPHDQTAGLVSVAMGVLLLLITVFAFGRRTVFHERAVVRTSLLGNRTVRYEDAEKLTYGLTRMYHNGIYSGTRIQLVVKPRPPAKGISFSSVVMGGDDDVESIKGFIAASIAERLHREVGAAGEIAWSGRVRLTKDGVRFSPWRLFGKAEPAFVPYSTDLVFDIDNGVLSVRIRGAKKALFTLACAGENFYPGLDLFRRLASEKLNP